MPAALGESLCCRSRYDTGSPRCFRHPAATPRAAHRTIDREALLECMEEYGDGPRREPPGSDRRELRWLCSRQASLAGKRAEQEWAHYSLRRSRTPGERNLL